MTSANYPMWPMALAADARGTEEGTFDDGLHQARCQGRGSEPAGGEHPGRATLQPAHDVGNDDLERHGLKDTAEVVDALDGGGAVERVADHRRPDDDRVDAAHRHPRRPQLQAQRVAERPPPALLAA
jgi:hypothetical protein